MIHLLLNLPGFVSLRFSQMKDVLSQMYAHVTQMVAGPVVPGGGDDDDDNGDTAFVSDSFSVMSIK